MPRARCTRSWRLACRNHRLRPPGRRPAHEFFITVQADDRMRALNREVERTFNPDRKDTHWGQRKLKREQ
jgi:hypothetical protein